MSGLTAELLLRAYMCGLFPMADSRDSPDLFWVDPEKRGIFPLEHFHIPRRLKKTVRNDVYRVTVDHAFTDVIEACAKPGAGRDNSWINDEIRMIYTRLFEMGSAHSVECWTEGELVGGLYGVDLAGAFFGESMFHTRRDASKVALVHLVARLKAGGYKLLDTQFVTEHLMQFGAIEIPRAAYHQRLKDALTIKADFYALPFDVEGETVLQSITQTS